jgi:hypothetical protein
LRRPTHLNWFFVVFCIVLTLFFGLACTFDVDGDFGATVCLTNDPSCSPDQASRELSARDAYRLLDRRVVRISFRAPGRLAAVPGGLHLLI